MTPDYILRALSEHLREDLDEVFEEEKQRVICRLENEKSTVIAATMLRLSEHLSIETLGKTIRLEILKSPHNNS